MQGEREGGTQATLVLVSNPDTEQKNVSGIEGVVNKNVAIPTKEVLIIVPLESMQELEVDSVQDVLFASGFGRVRNLPMF